MPRHFTLEEANRTLPLVERIVRDIVTDYRQWKELLYRYELVAASNKATDGESPAARELRERVDGLAQQINACVEELGPIGCSFKGFEDGLVDFRSRLDGREILLCWKLGEDSIGHWHEVNDGFAGRRKLEPAMIGAIGR